MSSTNPNGDADTRATITLTAGARKQAEWALLNELAHLLELAQENIEQLRDDGLHSWPLTADVRGPLRWINETVEVLDTLFGWQAEIDKVSASFDHPARTAKANNEGEDR